MQGSLPFQRRPNGLLLNKNENANLTRFLLLLILLVDATHQKTRGPAALEAAAVSHLRRLSAVVPDSGPVTRYR